MNEAIEQKPTIFQISIPRKKDVFSDFRFLRKEAKVLADHRSNGRSFQSMEANMQNWDKCWEKEYVSGLKSKVVKNFLSGSLLHIFLELEYG